MLQIVCDRFPGRVVHERQLEVDETTTGAHSSQWDGFVSSPGELQGRRLPARFSPARVVLTHSESLRDEATSTIACPNYQVEYADLLCRVA